MTQLWREIYYRISLAGGMIALVLMTTGFTADIGRFSDLLKPKEFFPAPVVASCEEKMQAHPPYKWEKPSWCQASAAHQELDKKKTENIF